MAGIGKRILVFFLILDILIVVGGFGGTGLFSVLEGNPASDNQTAFGFEIDYNQTTGEGTIHPPTLSTLISNSFFSFSLLLAGAAAILVGIATWGGDASFLIRIGFGSFLLGLGMFPLEIMKSTGAMPFTVLLLFGAVITVLWFMAVADWFGGADF